MPPNKLSIAKRHKRHHLSSFPHSHNQTPLLQKSRIPSLLLPFPAHQIPQQERLKNLNHRKTPSSSMKMSKWNILHTPSLCFPGLVRIKYTGSCEEGINGRSSHLIPEKFHTYRNSLMMSIYLVYGKGEGGGILNEIDASRYRKKGMTDTE